MRVLDRFCKAKEVATELRLSDAEVDVLERALVESVGGDGVGDLSCDDVARLLPIARRLAEKLPSVLASDVEIFANHLEYLDRECREARPEDLLDDMDVL